MTDKLREAAQQTEREAFEAWGKTQGTVEQGWWFRQLPDGGYSAGNPDVAWKAWQARAALAQQDARAAQDLRYTPGHVLVPNRVAWGIVGSSGYARKRAVDALRDLLNAAPTPPAQKGAKAMPLTEKQRVYFAQAWAMLDDYAADQRQAGNDSIADGADASAHEIKLMLSAAPDAPQPTKRVPLTEREVDEMIDRFDYTRDGAAQLARAIERAHGIGEKT